MDYAGGAAALSPGSGAGLSEAQRREMTLAAVQGIREEYTQYWIPSAYEYARLQITSERQDVNSEGVITNTVQTLAGTHLPDVNRWKGVMNSLVKAQDCMATGDVALGLAHYENASRMATLHVREFGKYAGQTAGSLDTAVTVVRVTRDIAFAAEAAILAVILAPIVVPSLLGAGASAAATTAASVGVGVVAGGTAVAASRGVGDMFGQLLAEGEVDWTQVGDNTWDGFKNGAIDGGFAVLSAAPAVDKLAGITAKQLAAQTGNRFRQAAITALRTGAKESTIAALQTLSEEALEFSTNAEFQEKWARDPSQAFGEFRARLVSSGVSSFVGGSLTGGLGRGGMDPEAMELARGTQREAAQVAARKLGMAGFTSIEGSARDACISALKGLPASTAQSVTAFCLARLQDGQPVTAEEIGVEIYKLGLGRAVSGSTGTVDGAATDLARALGELRQR
jgi:hypothetical protein